MMCFQEGQGKFFEAAKKHLDCCCDICSLFLHSSLFCIVSPLTSSHTFTKKMQETGSTECIFRVSEKNKSNYEVYWHLAVILVIFCFMSLTAVLVA